MGFRHVVMFRWADHVEPDHVSRVRAALDELASAIPNVRALVHGSDVGVADGNFDYVAVVDFDTIDDWRTYRSHPAHVLFVEEYLTGFVADRAAVQYQTPSNRDAFEYSAARIQELLAQADELG